MRPHPVAQTPDALAHSVGGWEADAFPQTPAELAERFLELMWAGTPATDLVPLLKPHFVYMGPKKIIGPRDEFLLWLAERQAAVEGAKLTLLETDVTDEAVTVQWHLSGYYAKRPFTFTAKTRCRIVEGRIASATALPASFASGHVLDWAA